MVGFILLRIKEKRDMKRQKSIEQSSDAEATSSGEEDGIVAEKSAIAGVKPVEA